MPGKAKKRDKGQEFAVIGLGRFGASLARRLEIMGHMVMGVDVDMGRVREIADEITSAVVLDATNEDALQEVDIASFGTVVVAIEEDFEATALITAYLKRQGISRVICMTRSRRHRDILQRIGADQVIVPDEDSGLRLAETLAAPGVLERAVLDEDHSLTELKVPASLEGQPVTSLSRYEIRVLLIQRPDGLIPCPGGEIKLETGDTLFAVGLREQLLEVASLP